MPRISAIFWDVGGVLLTNAWDHVQRTAALKHFGLDEAEFDDRHQMLVSSFERGKIRLNEYLDRTIFYRPRDFTREAFRDYMYSLSQPDTESLALAHGLAKSGNYLMSTINNESLELNQYRIQTFALRDIFTLFVSSCYVRLRKPEQAIYQLAMELTQHPPEESCFIDDRALNLESAIAVGMKAIHFENARQLREELRKLGVEA